MATAAKGWKCSHAATITENTNTYVKIKVEVFWQNDGHMYDINNVSAWVYCGSSSYKVKDNGSLKSTSSYTQKVSLGSHTFTVNKTTSSQSISCYGKITSKSSYVSGTKSSTSANVSVAAKPSYKVAYNANGGSGAPSSQTKWYGTNLTLSSTKPTRTGYFFQGWGTSSSDTSVDYAAGATYSANAAITLYAIWKANTYTVSYNANGGSGAPSSQTKTYGVNLTLSSTKPTRTNYNFKGWGTSASATTVAYAAGATYSNDAAITLYAIWELAYTKPRITNVSVQRCNSDGTINEEGTYLKFAFKWATDKTVSTVGTQWRVAGTSSWTDYKTIAASGTSGTVSWTSEDGWNTETSYEVRIYVTDSGSTTYTSAILINTVAYPIDVHPGGTGIAFGKVAETADLMDVAFKAQFRQSLKIPESISGSNIPLAYAIDSYSDFNTMLKGNPSFIGTAYSEGASAWYNIINLRHKNGSGDGTNYGLYLRSLLTSTGNLTWGKQYGSSSWQGERTLLDSSNYSNYAAPKSAATDSGWIYPTLNSKFENYSTTNKVRYRKIGKLVEVIGDVKATSTIKGSSTQYTIFTLPSGYRPSNRVSIICQGTSTYIWNLIVNTDGTVTFGRMRDGTTLKDCTTSHWLAFQVTFFVD